jgi:hypothetical protein
VVAYVRTVKTASGARAVQIVHSSRKGARDIEHLGSAHDEVELELLRASARQRLAGGADELDLGLAVPRGAGGPLPITASRAGHLWDALTCAYDRLGFDRAAGGDEVFRQLVLARIVEPTSKLDSLRVLAEVGVGTVSYPTVNRRLRVYSAEGWREGLAGACAAHVRLGPTTLVLFDATTLYFETHEPDDFRVPGYSKERRLEPQITVGLLTDASGFPLMVSAFEGNKAETATMLPVVKAFMAVHALADVVVVADAGMVSEANKKAIEAEGLSFVLGAKTPHVPYVVSKWRADHPGQEIPDGHVFTQPWPATAKEKRRDQVIYYRYSAGRARRTLKGIDEQIRKAESAVAGKTPVKRNRFVTLKAAKKTVNRDLEAKARALAGIKAYVTNIEDPDPEFVVGAYHRLFQIEKSFRMAKSDLAARPVYHRTRDSIEAHLTIVFAALAVSRWIEDTTGWSIKKFVTTVRRYRTVDIAIGKHTVTAADPLPTDVATALQAIKARAATH